MGAGAAGRFPCLGGKIQSDELSKRSGAPDDRAEPANAQEIVAHAMPFRRTRLPGKVLGRIEKIDRGNLGRIFQVERAARQSFIEIPHAPGGNSRGSGTDESFQFSFRRGFQDSFEDRQVDFFVPQGEAQVVHKAVARPVAQVEYVPIGRLPGTAPDVLFRDAARFANRRRDAKAVREQRPTGESAAGGHGSFLEDSNGGR